MDADRAATTALKLVSLGYSISFPVHINGVTNGHGEEIVDADGNTVCYVCSYWNEDREKKAQFIADVINEALGMRE